MKQFKHHRKNTHFNAQKLCVPFFTFLKIYEKILCSHAYIKVSELYMLRLIDAGEHSYCQELKGLMLSSNTVHPNPFYKTYFLKKLQTPLKNTKLICKIERKNGRLSQTFIGFSSSFRSNI